MAIGTDTGGSVRNPASCCGIVGMKATYGRVSRAGVFPLSFSLDHIGPMTRTVTDNALMLQAIAGADSKLQESINSGTVSSTKDGEFVVFTISGGSGGDYAAKLTIDNTGRLFVFLASTPSDKYKGETKKTLDRMLGSFTTYKSVSQFV